MGAPRTSIVLIGLRRSGKTTLGRALAAATGRTFLDTDELLLQRTGRSAAEWLRSAGEAALRAAEAELLSALVAERGSDAGPCVLATGGGTVLARNAAALLPRLGRVIWLDISVATAAARATASMDEHERPLLIGRSVAEESALLHAQRAPLYAALAAARIDANEHQVDVLHALSALVRGASASPGGD